MTQGLSAVNLAGPRAREIMAELTELDCSDEAFAYLDGKRADVAGVPCLILRIGFVGEVGYELHFPAAHGEHLWDALLDAGARARPAAVRARAAAAAAAAEDAHPDRPGHRLRVHAVRRRDALDREARQGAGLHRQVGARAAPAHDQLETTLVGFTLANGHVPTEGAVVMPDGDGPVGQVTSARFSPQLGGVIGMAWVPGRAGEGRRHVTISDEGKRLEADGHDQALLRPRRRGAALVSLEFLSPAAGGAVARSPMEREALAAGARLELRDGWNVAVGFDGAEPERERCRATRRLRRPLAARQARAAGAPISHGRLELGAGGALARTPGGARSRPTARWCSASRRAPPRCASALGRRRRGRRPDRGARRAHGRRAAGARRCSRASAALDLRPQVTPVQRLPARARWRARPARSCARPSDRFLMLFGAAYGEYVWTVVADAAATSAAGPSADRRSLERGPPCVTSSARGACGAAARELQGLLRRRDRRRRLARARRRLLPRARHGITDVAVLEKSYIGSGAAGRNTTILRANYKTPEGARFYDASLKLYEGLGAELDFNLLFSQNGHLTLAHSDRAMFVMANRAEVNRINGIDSRADLPGRDQEARAGDAGARPERRLSDPGRALPPARRGDPPRRGGLGPGARSRPRRGRDPSLHGGHRHRALERARRRRGHHPRHGRTKVVLNCTAGWSSLISEMAGVRLPITTHILQACVTEPLKPFLDVVIVSSQMHVYISQTDRGEVLMGAEIEPWTTYRMQGTLNFLQELSRHTLELFPQLERARILRSWAGLCDLSPDYSPILGETEVEGFHVSAGWGTYGFKAAPIVGKTLAELVATGRTPDLIEPFKLERFYEDRLVSELAAAAVSH